jgi:hypothetical protein
VQRLWYGCWRMLGCVRGRGPHQIVVYVRDATVAPQSCRHDGPVAEDAGITWYASPATHVGYELIGAALLIIAGGGRGFPLDYDELERWTRVGYERGMRSRKGER